MAIALTAVNCPLPPIPTTLVYAVNNRTVTAVPPTSDKATQGMLGGGLVAAWNRNATAVDLIAKYGAGVYAIAQGLAISVGTGLNVNVAAGQAVIDGIVEFTATQAVAVDPNIARAQLWLKSDGTIVVVNNSLTPPAGHLCYLGSCVSGAATITSVDTSGVVYLRQGEAWRETADLGIPTDAPGSSRRFWHRTQGGTYYWDGYTYKFVPGSHNRAGAHASITGVVSGDTYWSNDSPYLGQYDGSTWAYKGPAYPLSSPGLVSAYTARGTAFTTTDDTKGGIYAEKSAAAGTLVCMLTKAIPATPFSIEFAIVINMFNVATCFAGACFYESATGKIITIGYERPGGFSINKWTNNTTFSAAYDFISVGSSPFHFLKIRYDGTNLLFYVSYDGNNWWLLRSSAKANFFTTAPDEYGFFVNTNNATWPTGIRVLSLKVINS